MKAMILAAGAGTRLRPLTDAVPKPMLPVAGEPLLAHTLRWLKDHGIKEVALNLHHLPDVVRQGLGDGVQLGMRLTYSYEPTLLGTAGAAKKIESFFNTPFVVVYGDLLLDVDLEALIDLHHARRAHVTIGLKPTDEPRSQGMVACDPTGRVVRFVEKPQHWPADERTANAGVYIVEPRVLDAIPADQIYDWGHDVFPRLLAAGAPVYGQLVRGRLLDIGTPHAYALVRNVGLTGAPVLP